MSKKSILAAIERARNTAGKTLREACDESGISVNRYYKMVSRKSKAKKTTAKVVNSLPKVLGMNQHVLLAIGDARAIHSVLDRLGISVQ